MRPAIIIHAHSISHTSIALMVAVIAIAVIAGIAYDLLVIKNDR